MLINELKAKEFRTIDVLLMAKKIFFENWTAFLLITIILFFPVNLVLSLLSQFILQISLRVDLFSIINQPELFRQFLLSPDYDHLRTYTILYYGILLLFFPLGIMAYAKFTYEKLKGVSISYMEAIQHAFTKIPAMLLSTILMTLGISIGFFFFFLPGLYFTFVWAFTFYGIILRNLSATKAMGYSAQLMRGYFFRITGILLMLTIVAYGFAYLISSIFITGAGNFIIDVIVRMVISIVCAYLFTCFTVLFCNREYFMKPPIKR